MLPLTDQTKLARDYFRSLQNQICGEIVSLHERDFRRDNWEREGGGGGETRVFEEGAFLEKGGVNFSEVYGDLTPEFAKALPLGDGLEFYATGISLVLHPVNPFAPTVHANFRYLQRGTAGWFGGGADLTPVYPFEEDAIHFHTTYFKALEPYKGKYQDFKKQCDQYFYLPHRKETRGIGGIFFDYQDGTNPKTFEIVKSCGDVFTESYMPIAKKRFKTPYTDAQKEFQEYRRGRYVEFNLIYDRGTTFGLKTNGRVESILMSLPLKARWVYGYEAKPGSPEAKLLDFLKPRDWVKGMP